MGKEFIIQGLVGNDDYLVNSVRFYDAKTDIKLGEVMVSDEQQTLESTAEQL